MAILVPLISELHQQISSLARMLDPSYLAYTRTALDHIANASSHASNTVLNDLRDRLNILKLFMDTLKSIPPGDDHARERALSAAAFKVRNMGFLDKEMPQLASFHFSTDADTYPPLLKIMGHFPSAYPLKLQFDDSENRLEPVFRNTYRLDFDISQLHKTGRVLSLLWKLTFSWNNGGKTWTASFHMDIDRYLAQRLQDAQLRHQQRVDMAARGLPWPPPGPTLNFGLPGLPPGSWRPF